MLIAIMVVTAIGGMSYPWWAWVAMPVFQLAYTFFRLMAHMAVWRRLLMNAKTWTSPQGDQLQSYWRNLN